MPPMFHNILHAMDVRPWARRLTGKQIAALALVTALSLALVGCLAFSDRSFWAPKEKPEPPPEITLNRMVRVRLLGRRAQSTFFLEVASPYTLTESVGNRVIVQSDQPLARTGVRLAPGGGLMIGEKHFPQEDVIISPKRDASVVVNDKTYRGLLRINKGEGGLLVTNQVDVEAYLLGVLRGELPRNFHIESFKAQCLAARTYVLYQMSLTPANRDFDVFDDEGSQMYIGVAGEDENVRKVVQLTRGQVCTYDDGGKDRIFCTYYSSACGGITQAVATFKPNDPQVPPLAGGTICEDCYLATFYRWEPVKLSKEEVTKRIVARYPTVSSLGKIVGLRPKELTPDGRIVRIQLDGANGKNETLVGEDFRLCLGGRVLKSANFVIETGPDYFVFRNGKGFGHGVGLCQNGMETKARRGMTYREILSIYYPHSKITTLYQ